MNIDKQFVLKALLQQNFLPSQKAEREELPPAITSISFSEVAAQQLVQCRESPRRRPIGYDAVQYKSTRFNGVPRVLSILHPKAYADLALSISDNWKHLKYTTENTNSRIIPERHPDGRVVIMDYESRLPRTQQMLELSFAHRFMVCTDIANCFPSIYSHAVPWALVGVEEAKKNASERSKWYNKLDRALRMTKRNQTNGIAIGPATSNIISEAILARVDRELQGKFTYTRYLDDYTAYCETYEKAQQFILELVQELGKYELALNIGKTEILPLPQTSSNSWIVDLNNALPKRNEVSVHDAMNYLEFVVLLADKSPDGSVLKYGFRSLVNRMVDTQNEETVQIVLRHALNLSFHGPILLPVIGRLLDKSIQMTGIFHYKEDIQALMREHIRLRHSDGISWLLYFSNRYGVPIRDCCSLQIVESEDCIPMLLLYLSNNQAHQNQVIEFAKKLDSKDLYRLDQYWILLYQLFLENKIVNPYEQDTSFDLMEREGVTFVVPSPGTP